MRINPANIINQSTVIPLLPILVTITTWNTDKLLIFGYACGVFVLAAWASWRSGNERSPLGIELAPVACIGAWGFLQIAVGSVACRNVAITSSLQNMALAATAFAGFQAYSLPCAQVALRRCLIWFGVAIAIVSVLSYWTSYGKILWMVPAAFPDNWGPFPSRNNFAQFLELCLPVALYEFRGKNFCWTSGLPPAILLGAGLASASRAGAILLLAETIVVLSLLRPRWRTTLTAATLALSIAAAAGGGVLLKRFADPDPFRIRREIVHSTLAMIAQRPWTGYGLGAFAAAYPEFATFDNGAQVEHAHNDWLEWTAEGGVFYAAAWAALAIGAVKRAMRSIWGIGVIAVFLHALVDYPFARLGISAWVFLMLGALFARREKPEKSTHPEALSRRGKSVRLETVQSILAVGCVVNLALGALAHCLAAPPAFGATPVIGTAVAQSSFRVDDATVAGNATLFEGATVETQRSSSALALASGTRLVLGADSKAQIFGDRLILQHGSGEMREAAGFRVEARGLTVRTETGHSSARIALDGSTRVQVAALTGGTRVLNSRGLLVATLNPGTVLEFEPQGAGGGAAGEPEKLTGCLRLSNGHFLVTDDITNVTVELAGAGLDKEAGNHVQVTGLMDPTGVPASGATQYIRISSLRRLGKGCPADKTAAAGAGGAANSGSGSGHGRVIGLSTTALAVIGGVAAAAVVGGLAATGSIGSGSSGSAPVSR